MRGEKYQDSVDMGQGSDGIQQLARFREKNAERGSRGFSVI